MQNLSTTSVRRNAWSGDCGTRTWGHREGVRRALGKRSRLPESPAHAPTAGCPTSKSGSAAGVRDSFAPLGVGRPCGVTRQKASR